LILYIIPKMYGAGLLYCWFIAEMVGETRPYKSVIFDFSLGGRVY
jgi:hypothetical protein